MMTNKAYDVVVIGAGVIGTSTAYHLVKKGLSVALVDRSDVARGTSSHCDAMAMLTDKQPGADAALGYASILRFLELQKELSYDFECRQEGSLYVCENDSQLELATKYVKQMQSEGYDVHIADPYELHEREPFLARDLTGGIWSSVDCGLNPYKLCFAFVDQVLGKGLDLYAHNPVTGIKLDEKGAVCGVETEKGTLITNKVVNACGVWSNVIGDMVGVNIPVLPRKGVILITNATSPICHQKVQDYAYNDVKFGSSGYKLDPDVEKYNIAFTIEPTRGNTVLVGSSRNFMGYSVKAELDVARAIAKRAIRFYPILKDMNCIRTYAGLRPFLEDHLPLITDVEKVPGFYIATGHEGDGISMAPMTGQLMAELIAGEKPYLDITPFSYSRYDKKN